MATNIKVWTTLPKSLHDQLKIIAEEFGYSDAELLREVIRRGLNSFQRLQAVKINQNVEKETQSILKTSLELDDEIPLKDIDKRFKKNWN